MAACRSWSAVLTREPVQQLPDPHPASAAVTADGTTYCSSILPWRSCGTRAPWVGATHADKTAAAMAELDAALPDTPLIWGGDWNHALDGREYAGAKAAEPRSSRCWHDVGFKCPPNTCRTASLAC